MELSTVPHRSPTGERRRLVLGVLVLTPVVLLVLLPAVLGLDRYVVADDAAGDRLGKGSVVLDRDVPAGDLRRGDLVTFGPASGISQGPVTRRVVAIHQGVATVRGAGASRHDRVQIRLDHATYPRVIMHVPWVGYPFLVEGGWLISFVLLAGVVLLLAWNVHRRRPRVTVTPPVTGARAAPQRVVGVG